MDCLLALNGGSSSLKFAVYEAPAGDLRLILSGGVERIGRPEASLSLRDRQHDQRTNRPVAAADHGEAVRQVIDRLDERIGFDRVGAVGHRVVHGGQRYSQPERITPELLDELRRLSPLDPDHLPAEISMIEAVSRRAGDLGQVACFDTAFHRGMPRVARLMPIPRRFDREGVERYGFHGLSYAYLMEELTRVAGPEAARGRVILAHLGAGASLAAVREGRSVDTSMGFTPTAGLPMATRSGDLDPGLVAFLARNKHMSPERFHDMVNHEAGLLGVSETTGDMKELLEREGDDERAAEAVAMFCYQARKWVGAFAAVLGGLDTLVFSGGIGQHAPEVRKRICRDLGFLGVELDEGRNSGNEPVISRAGGRATVRVIPTDEELMVARATLRIIGDGS